MALPAPVVTEALRASKPDPSKPRDAPTEAAYRYRWRTQAGYLRDLVIWALSPRMRRPKEIQYADLIIDAVRDGDREMSSAIDEITATEVQALKGDPAFRLQMIFQAALAMTPRLPMPCPASTRHMSMPGRNSPAGATPNSGCSRARELTSFRLDAHWQPKARALCSGRCYPHARITHLLPPPNC